MILDFPVYRALSVTRALNSATALVRSPFTGQSRSQFWGGEWWSFDVEMATMARDDGRLLDGFFAQLSGRRHTFMFADPSARFRDGVVDAGLPQVRGAGQTGTTLATDGWLQGRILQAGMFISFGTPSANRFHQILNTVYVGADGLATFTIAPELREAPADNTAIEYLNPKVRLRLTGATPASVGLADFYRFSFAAEEAL